MPLRAPKNLGIEKKQGRIHSNPIVDGWAGAVMRNPLGFKKCNQWTDEPTYRLTNQHGKMQLCVRD